MQTTQNEDQRGPTNIAWLIGRYANGLKQLRGHYESLLRPSHAWRSWAVGRMANWRGISVALPNGMSDGGIAMGGILPPIIYRWMSAAHPYVGSPFYWPRLPLLWYSPLWRLWSQTPPLAQEEPEEAASLEYYATGEHLAAPSHLVEQASVDEIISRMLLRETMSQPPKEALGGGSGSRFPLTALPLELSLARMLTSHGIVFAPELAFHPSSLLYPETELVYHPISTLLRMAAHTELPDSSDGQGISPYTYWGPTPALIQNVPLLRHVTPLSTATGELPLGLLHLPLLSAVAPATLVSDVGMRHFVSPSLIEAAFPLTPGVPLELRTASWPLLNMPLASPSFHSDLIQAQGYDMENLTSWDAVLGEQQARMKEMAFSSPKVPSPAIDVSSDYASPSSSSPYVLKPEMAHLQKVLSRRQVMLVRATEGHLAEEVSPAMVIIPPSVLQSLAIFKPDEPYLTLRSNELYPTMAIQGEEDAPTFAMPQGESAAFAVSRYSERLPLAHKALRPISQHMRVLEGEDGLYSTFTPRTGAIGQRGDLEDVQTPPFAEMVAPPQTYYDAEQIFPEGEAMEALGDLESPARFHGNITPWAETAVPQAGRWYQEDGGRATFLRRPPIYRPRRLGMVDGLCLLWPPLLRHRRVLARRRPWLGLPLIGQLTAAKGRSLIKVLLWTK